MRMSRRMRRWPDTRTKQRRLALKRSLAALNLFPGRGEQNPEYIFVVLQRRRFIQKWAAGCRGQIWYHPAMRRLSEYLEQAQKFEQLAAEELDAQIKAQFEAQAAYCRSRAERRAEFLRALGLERNGPPA